MTPGEIGVAALARALWVACLLGIAANSRAATVTNRAERMIITLRAGVDVDKVIKDFSLRPSHTYRHALNGFAVSVNSEAAAKLKRDSRVLAVEPDGKAVLCDQTYGTGIVRMGVTNFPVAHIDGNDHRMDVDVAVLDSGIQTNHPDLNVFQSVGFTASGIVDDTLGHGTHVAGIIGALDNNIGVVGVAPGVRLWSVKVFDTSGSDWSTILMGMDYVASNADRIAVVNASFTSDGITPAPIGAIEEAVSNIVSQGAVFVAAAGNAGQDLSGNDFVFGTPDDFLPAALPEVMAVSAMDPVTDTIASFSNYSYIPRSNNFVLSPGMAIDVAAPGVTILSTWINSGYAFDTGTSMAAPHAAGLVALYIAANGRAYSAAGVYQIRQTIVSYGQPQTEWNPDGEPAYFTTNSVEGETSVTLDTGDPDGNYEPLAVASESWVPQPTFTGFTNTPSGFQLSFAVVPGYAYTLQSTSDLGGPNSWSNLSTVDGTGSVATVTLTDTNLATAAFYRLVRQPSP